MFMKFDISIDIDDVITGANFGVIDQGVGHDRGQILQFYIQRSHSFGRKKIPGVFQSNFRIFQVLSVIVRNRISNTFGPQ